MARIRTYDLDTTVSINDHLLGNDGDNPSAIATKRFALSDVRAFFLEGLNVDILGQIPRGHDVTVNQDGTGLDRSTVRVTHNNLDITTALALTGQIFYSMDTNGGTTIRFENYELAYYLPSLVGKNITFTTGLTATTYTATIVSYSGLQYRNQDPNARATSTTTPEVYNDIFVIAATGTTTLPIEDNSTIQTITIGGQPTDGNIIRLETEFASIRVTGDATIQGNTTINGSTTVDGTTLFNNDVTLGTADPNTDPVNLTVHGTIDIEDTEGGLRFGHPDPSISFTTDGDNLTVAASGTGDDRAELRYNTDQIVLPGNNVTLQDGDLTVTGDIILMPDPGGNGGVLRVFDNSSPPQEQPPIRQVYVNGEGSGTEIGNRGTAHTINVGDATYDIPIASSQVAQILPGLHEDLSPTNGDTILGSLFYGTDEGTFVNWESGTVALTAETITNGVTTYILTEEANQTAFNTAFSGVPTSQRLFFVAAGETLPTTQGERVAIANVYEVVYYDHSTFTVTFSRIGQGHIVISSNQLSFTNLPPNTAGTGENLVLTDDSGEVYSNSITRIAGAQSTLRATQGTTTGTLQQIEYEGNHNVTFNGSNLVVDTSGRYDTTTLAAEQTADFSAVAFGAYILGAIAANPMNRNYGQTITLPPGNAGDSVKIINLSTVADGGGPATSGTWRIIPSAGERIMKLTADTNLILDDPAASFELLYTNAAVGWVMIGIN